MVKRQFLKILIKGIMSGISTFGILMLVSKYEPELAPAVWSLIGLAITTLSISVDLHEDK
jgi:hypothetical protein